jgi:hypothetical protein
MAKQELRVGTGDVNKTRGEGTVCGNVLTPDGLERLAPGLRAVRLRCGVASASVPALS